ncbi:MAG: ATP-binding protein [Paludibacter sp.]|nr:ATP-binding protein [Paludibacter sp.]
MYKIAVIGPESTGKSALTKALARYYKAPAVDEYAREYVEQLGRPYTYEDVCTIAHTQIAAETRYENQSSSSLVFFDTELIITKVWLEYSYQRVPSFVDDQLIKGFFDLYLLCDTDLPWEPDPVREHGDDREYFFEWYRREIELLSKPYVVIRGIGEQRLENAIQAIENWKTSIH